MLQVLPELRRETKWWSLAMLVEERELSSCWLLEREPPSGREKELTAASNRGMVAGDGVLLEMEEKR